MVEYLRVVACLGISVQFYRLDDPFHRRSLVPKISKPTLATMVDLCRSNLDGGRYQCFCIWMDSAVQQTHL